MSKHLDWKYYKIKINDESKETKCNKIVICEIYNPSKKKHCYNFWNINSIFCSLFEIEKNHKVQCDHDNKLVLHK